MLNLELYNACLLQKNLFGKPRGLNLIWPNFCVGVDIKLKLFDSTEFEIKFAIDWYTGGTLRGLKKPSKEPMSHVGLCMWFWVGSLLNLLKFSKNSTRVKITSQNPELAHFFSWKTLRWLKIRIIVASNSISLRILSHLRIFELKKWANSGFWLVILTRAEF